ncbi:MAG: hypothetical protein LHV69_03365 [Elusimicrobia bacterium]|nr:hypothetical protein [Candidatus Obscuribacterium magneticum]
MKRERGQVLIMMLFVSGLLFGVTFLVFNVARAHYRLARAQSLADSTLISSLRIRIDGLAKIAERWGSIQSLFLRGDDEGGTVLAAHWPALEEQARTLERALPGYKGRIRSVVSVVAEAQDEMRESVNIIKEDGSFLGVSPEALQICDESGRTSIMRSIWYRRLWALEDGGGEPQERSVHEVTQTVPLLTGGGLDERPWILKAFASGRVVGDVNLNHPVVQSLGNGGFPRVWPETLVDGRVDPFRYPYYRARLDGGVFDLGLP